MSVVATQSPSVNIGSEEAPVMVDVAKLLDSRLLIQAMSGGGKSRLLRKLAEELTKHVPVIIIDREGEFSTLLEVCDMLLIGGGGAIAASVKTAGALARRLAENRVSAVIDLSDLSMEDKREYVRDFLVGLMHVPREFWKPLAVLIDEAHDFAPQSGDDTALAAVNALMSQGRKRGFGGILATQRLSKLNKDSAAECANICIGRTSAVDKERAADLLGVPRNQRDSLTRLGACHWSAVGPAFGTAGDPIEFKAAQGQSTHPEAGKRHEYTPPEPSAAMLALAAQFKELEAEPAEGNEPEDLEAAKELIRDLRSKVQVLNVCSPDAEQNAYGKGCEAGREYGRRTELEAIESKLADLANEADLVTELAETAMQAAKKHGANVDAMIEATQVKIYENDPERSVSKPPVANLSTVEKKVLSEKKKDTSRKPGKCLSLAQFRIINALAWFQVVGIHHPSRANVAAMARVSPKSSGFDKNVSTLSTAGLLMYPGPGLLAITERGQNQADKSEEKGSLEDLHQAWRESSALSTPQVRMLNVLIKHRKQEMTREQFARLCDVSPKSSGFDKNVSGLSSLGLLEYPRPGLIRATSMLFLEGLK